MNPPPQPTEIGPYRILDTLGEGGMGTVYLAEQREPVKRRVALKLIKLGMDSKAVVHRFEQERQALAVMDHEGIAKVFDCGTSERGQPFFVMELVKGIPLHKFCEQQQLSLPERLLLMRQVCAAVQHAHQKGVVHRDLKPDNVLVSNESGRLQVKIIDFGLAKAMGQKLVEATLFTAVGQIIGTPEYMAPEQADPTNDDIDTRADIYSLGVMLYQVLVGELPFPSAEMREKGMLEVQRVLREVEPPKPSTRLTAVGDVATELARTRRISVSALRKALKTDLDWVVLKALEKDRNRRYDTANALSADLQRYLDHEPLVAGPPSAGYRLKKLVRRYRGQVLAGTAVLTTAIVGAVVAVNYAISASDNEQTANRRAEENAKLATSEAAAKERFQAKVRDFDQLSGLVQYDRAVATEAELYPGWPQKVPAMNAWLRTTDGLLGKEQAILDTVASLRDRALPQTPAEIEAAFRAHARHPEYERLANGLASLHRADAIRRGEPMPEVTLSADQQALDASALNLLAWRRVAPKAAERELYGEEALGLAAARAAVAKDRQPNYLDTLAWALLANGQDDEARQVTAEALAASLSAAERALSEGRQHDLEAAVTEAAENLAAAERELADLREELRTWQFGTSQAEEAAGFLHGALTGLLAKLAALKATRASVLQRREWANGIRELTLAHPNARHTWGAVRQAIAASEKYAGLTIELRDEDVLGLVPIGSNPVTGLWEFYELRSAWDGTQNPGEIAIPEHRSDGSIEVTGDTGIVFVLLPGGAVTLGSQGEDEDAPFHDPQRFGNETLHEVTLSPFFLARHELTQGQWGRLWTWDKDLRYPSQHQAGTIIAGRYYSLANPVEQVDWSMCDTVLTRHGLVLPTEAQWEYGCRGGTTTPWIVELAKLKEVGNLADATAKAAAPVWNCEPWRDGYTLYAPVGSFLANAFGLYDVHGNVSEWCRDQLGPYGTETGGDGARPEQGDSSVVRQTRGGSFAFPASRARSAYRTSVGPSIRAITLGLRPARALR